ncbi:MAG: hypothetical protein GY847_08305 [Proteobacteria bacterium]|nr:hypothetical protein [Pseudomonadota bacterium]
MRTKIIMIIIGVIAVTSIASLCFGFGRANHKCKNVSLMQVIVNPKKYHGKLVRVIGVSRVAFEGNGIWFSKEHYEYHIYKNSLWIEPDYEALETTPQQLEKYNGQYVLMEGVFNKNDHGHKGMNSGSLERITRFQLWDPPSRRSQQQKDAQSAPVGKKD